MNILLLACYELGHQPLSLAWPLAALREAGFPATGVDLSVQPFPEEKARQANIIAISAPMHTALRLGFQAARRVREINPDAHLCFYGLYAWMNQEFLLESSHVNSIIGGEYEQPLVNLIRALAGESSWLEVEGITASENPARPYLNRLQLPTPERDMLPTLDNYARFRQNGHTHLAGYTESSRGCLHTCRHCPVVPVYNGRFFAVPVDTVMADIRQQVQTGARHITFGDPDFLNGPTHALRVARALQAEFPALTFDFTTKVEHILKYPHHLHELKECGAAFVVSAFESLSDEVLNRLAKGHSSADLDTALEILDSAGLHVHPTWVPFTPWTTMQDYLEMLDWIRDRNLISHIPIVQLSIRLLVPPGSALLSQPGAETWFGELDTGNFTHTWSHPDPRMDMLQQQAASLAEEGCGSDPLDSFFRLEKLAYEIAGESPPESDLPARMPPEPPRLTEDWFC